MMITIKHLLMPDGIGGTVSKYGDNKYLILIDSTLTPKKQVIAEIHELSHILLGHLDDGCTLNVDDCENLCNEFVDRLIS